MRSPRVTRGKGAPQWRFWCLCTIFIVAITTEKDIQFDLLCFSEWRERLFFTEKASQELRADSRRGLPRTRVQGRGKGRQASVQLTSLSPTPTPFSRFPPPY